MRNLFIDLLGIDGVKGVMFFALSGQLLFEEFTIRENEPACSGEWYALAVCLGKIRETELVFEKGRLYVRRTAEGVLVVVLGLVAPREMIRLTCDILLAAMRKPKPTRGIKRFFKL
jgi:hypothetical protein